jgi:hypothetical protein
MNDLSFEQNIAINKLIVATNDLGRSDLTQTLDLTALVNAAEEMKSVISAEMRQTLAAWSTLDTEAFVNIDDMSDIDLDILSALNTINMMMFVEDRNDFAAFYLDLREYLGEFMAVSV